MKTRKSIARLLSFLMVLSLLLGISAAPVYAVGGEGETASFEITEANGQTGTVQYKLDSGEFTVADSTPVDLEGVSSITIKATPVADAQVNQSHSGITGTEHAVSFDYTDLTSESGWTYQIQDNDGNITFTIVFDNHDGTGGGSNPGGGGGEGGEGTYTVYFGEGSWEIGGVTVTADKTDVQYLAYNDIITLENFDPETMEVRVEAEDGFSTTLAVTNNQTSISAHTNDGGVPADIAFSVVSKSSEPGGGGGEDLYFIDFSNAPWTVDGVEVDLEGRESVAELMVWITTEDVIPLTNFDPDTMDAVLIVDEDVTLLLNVDENGNTRLADVDGGVEVLPPYGATMTFAVVAKPGGEGENVYYIDLGTGDWTVGDVTVSAPDGMSGVVPILDTETIPTEMLANFDPETMDITLTVSDGFVIYLEIDENGNTTLVSTRDGVELPPYGETLTFAVVAKPVDNEEFETENFTLTDDKGNVISLTYEKNRELSFTMIDYLAFSPEDLETAGISQEFYDSAMKGIKNATKQHGTLLSFYEIQVENDDGFLIHEGPFYIKIKMTDEMKKYDIFKIVYIDVEDNLATESPITLTQEGGYLVGTLEHLSTYALVGDNAPGENDAPADSDTSAPTSPQTGDNSNLGLWVFLLVLSSCSMIALIVIDKKRKIAK